MRLFLATFAAATATTMIVGVSGTIAVCGEDQHVVNHDCRSCPGGKTNRGGDDPTGPDSECDGPLACSSHEFVHGGECKECPTGTNLPGGGNSQYNDALGLEIPCQSFKCVRPVVAPSGYDLSLVSEKSLSADAFSVENVICAAGFEGTPRAVSCAEIADAHRPSEYGVEGCVPCPHGRFRRALSFDANSVNPPIDICLMCHRCVTSGGREVVDHECDGKKNRKCKCAPGFVGEASTPRNLGGSCVPDPSKSNQTTPLAPLPLAVQTPVDAYNLGTLMAHCQIWVRENHARISIFNQHLARLSEQHLSKLSGGRKATDVNATLSSKSTKSNGALSPISQEGAVETVSTVMHLMTCHDFCVNFESRMDSTVCLGICDVAGYTAFISGLSLTDYSDLDVCNAIFSKRPWVHKGRIPKN